MPLPKHPLPDPVYASSFREVRWILGIWSLFFVWVLGYCTLYGYFQEEETLETVLGMPSWVFWGVCVPWVTSVAITSWFALSKIEDHPLDPGTPAERGEQK